MITIKQALVVEGKYDLIKLSQLVNGVIIPTNGFRIFKNKEQLQLLKTLAAKNGLLIMTDSDAAGFKIRSFLGSVIPKEQITHVYIPSIAGKERRKEAPSKEGLLGVEGVEDCVILEALERFATPKSAEPTITKYDLFEQRLSGTPDAAERRRRYLKQQNLPPRMNSNVMLDVLNHLMSREEFLKTTQEL